MTDPNVNMTGSGGVTPPDHTHEDINGYCATYIFTAKEKKDDAEVVRFAKELMQAVAESCFRRGATSVGHIKAHLEYGEGGFLYADTLGDPTDIMVRGREGKPTEQVKLVINSIVVELDGHLIQEATEEAVDAVIARYGFTKEITEQDVFDADDHDHLEIRGDVVL